MQLHFGVYISSVWMFVYECNKVEGLELKFLDYLSCIRVHIILCHIQKLPHGVRSPGLLFLSRKRRKLVLIFLQVSKVSKTHGKHMVRASQVTQQQPSSLQHTHLLGLYLPAVPATVASSSVNLHHKECSTCVMV